MKQCLIIVHYKFVETNRIDFMMIYKNFKVDIICAADLYECTSFSASLSLSCGRDNTQSHAYLGNYHHIFAIVFEINSSSWTV